MPTRARRSFAPIPVLSAAILASGLLAPAGASARHGENRNRRTPHEHAVPVARIVQREGPPIARRSW